MTIFIKERYQARKGTLRWKPEDVPGAAKKAHKFHATRTAIDGITFASKKEAHRYQELKLLEAAGQIKDLRLQPRFPLIVNEQLVCTYVADFSYIEKDRNVVEDVKGFKTPEYKLKSKLFKTLHPSLDFREV